MLIGAASDATKESPRMFVFELTVWSIVTVSSVPAGITTGGGGVGWLGAVFAAGAPAAGAFPSDAFDGFAVFPVFETEFCGVLDLLHPPIASKTPITNHRTALPVFIL